MEQLLRKRVGKWQSRLEESVKMEQQLWKRVKSETAVMEELKVEQQ